MKNKFLNLFVILCLLFLNSCTNIIENKTPAKETEGFYVGLGETAANTIERTLSENKNINENTELKVVCKLFGVYSDTQTKNVTLPELKNLKFNMTKLPFGNGYYFTLNIYYNNISLYSGISEDFNLNQDNKNVNIKLTLKKDMSSIKYVLNGGSFSEEQEKIKKNEYFIDTFYEIPAPWRNEFFFEGWYTNKEFSGNPIKELGKNNYLGNVTLYAKWREYNKVPDVKITPELENIDFTDTVGLVCNDADAVIYYTTDGTEPTENSSKYTIPFALNNDKDIKDNIITVKAFATKLNMKSSNVSTKQYKINRYSVNFDVAGGNPEIPQKTGLKKGDVILISDIPVVTRDGFNFSGWNIGTGNENVKDSYTVQGGITLTAQWTEKDKTPKVSITGEPLIDYGEEIILSCDTAPDAEIYYTIDGTVPGKTSTKYIPGTTHITADKDFVLKAIAYKEGLKESDISETSFTIKTYKVTFDNGSYGTAPSEITGLKKGDKLTPDQLKDLTADGYNFIQWQTEHGEKVDTNTVITSDLIIFAKWTPITYTVNFDSNGGAGTKSSIKVTYDVDTPFGDNPFTKDGFEFVKWGDSTGKIEYKSANNLCKKEGETITIYALWNDIPPADITELKSETSDGKVILSWKNPTVADFDNVEITCKEDSSKNLTVKKDTSKAIATAEYTGLPNDKIYTFTLKAVDGGGNKSIGLEKKAFASAGCQLTETVKNLPGGTDGSAGTSGTYVEFGDYPQSLMADNVVLSDNTVKVNSVWDCYLGNDGISSAYYVKATANMLKNVNHNNPDKADTLYKFNNKELIKEGAEYYFKLEPIKWRIVDTAYTDGGNIKGFQQVTGKLLVAEKALAPTTFYNCSVKDRSMNGKKVDFNNYQYSTLRAYLNGMDGTSWGDAGKYINKGFINEAFTPAAQNILNMVTLDNSLESSRNCPENNDPNWKEHNFYCEGVQDKVFVLSQEEVTNNNYFPEDWMTMSKNSRFRQATEYSRTIGSLCTMGDGTNVNMYNSDWWLRSPNYANGWQSRYVGNNGRPNRSYNCDFGSASIVPAIVIEGTRSPDKTAPGPVTELKCTTGNGKVVFTWTPPADRDFARVEIICKEDIGKKVSVDKGTNTGTISGLTNGQKYTFDAKAYDACGNVSSAVQAEASLYVLTETVRTLTGADGSAGTSGTYVEFGDYPKTYVKNAPVGTDKVIIGGLDYYYGTDGNYYVQVTASPDGDCSFDNKDKITQGEKYYFKVEPIKWRVLDSNYAVPSGTGKLLVAENALASCSFFSYIKAGSIRNIGSEATVYSNNYEHSKIRAFLTGVSYTDDGNKQSSEFERKGFINQAFTDTAVNSICQIEVDNTIATTSAGTENYICKNTNDKVFLLSYKDITNTSYGFGTYGTNIAALRRASTDYSRATGVLPTADNSTWWCTRSPNTGTKGDNTGCSIHRLSSVSQPKGDRGDTNYDNYGVVPAIVVTN